MKRDRRLPFLSEAEFLHQLREAVGDPESVPLESIAQTLYRHYSELRRWNPRISLIGPGTVDDLVRRHYGESLAAPPLLGTARHLVDIGSGAGFPGLVLAAARPDLEVTLVEARERKHLFLRTAVRKSGLSCRCLNARVGRPLPAALPDPVELVTCRALALAPEIFELFRRHTPQVRFLLWSGGDPPDLPASFDVHRQLPLPGARTRRILEIRTK